MQRKLQRPQAEAYKSSLEGRIAKLEAALASAAAAAASQQAGSQPAEAQ
jgi:BMFP domain-containing protein YqiC